MDSKQFAIAFITIVIGAALIPTVADVSATAAESVRDHTTYYTLNSDFSDNTGTVPDNWTDVITDNRLMSWDDRGYGRDNGNDGTAEWYQSLVVPSVSDGVYTATINASFKLGDNTGLTSFTAQLILDDGIDNHIMWQTTSLDNSIAWETIENDIAENIAPGTYYIRLFDEVTTTAGTENVVVYWDDAGLTVVTHTNTFSSIVFDLMPLFYVMALLFAVIAWVTHKE